VVENKTIHTDAVKYTTRGNKLTVTGNGILSDNLDRIFGENRVTQVIIGEGITGIDSCLLGCNKLLISVAMPESFQEIRPFAFNGCINLKEVKIPGGVKSIGRFAFSWCIKLKTVEISEGVSEIGESSFMMCKSLSEIAIPASITYIMPNAFRDCHNLRTIRYGGTQTQWNNLITTTGVELPLSCKVSLKNVN